MKLPLLLALLCGCDAATLGPTQAAPDAGASPEASIRPRPLATAAPLAGSTSFDDPNPDAAPPPPTPFSPGEVLSPDPVPSRELSGVSLMAQWRWRSVPASPKVPQVAAEALERARQLTRGECQVRLSPYGRMRMSFVSRGLPLAPGAALMSRSDRYGHLLVWPDEQRYRALQPGVLRAILGEGRADMTPLSRPRGRPLGDGERLGYKTRKVELGSSYGTVRLELASVPESGDGARLLCRSLVEVVGIDPGVEICDGNEIPLLADYTWRERDGTGLSFEVTALSRQNDLPAQDLAVPLLRATAQGSSLPTTTRFFDDNELRHWRKDDVRPPDPIDPKAPDTGITGVNQSDVPLYLLVDGVPIGVVRPWGELRVAGLRPGRYTLQWRSFLGEMVGDAAEHDVPIRLVWGEQPDAEVRDGG